jgi:glycosyltransferase involved in cell wall biosynthesis
MNNHITPLHRDKACFPRTLIVGANFCEHSGVGTFLGRLFSTWPAEKMATISADRGTPDWQRCQLFYRLGRHEYPPIAIIRWLLPRIYSGPIPPPGSDTPLKVKKSSSSILGRLAQHSWRALLQLLGCTDMLYSVIPSPQVLKWVREFKPEVIYAHFSSLNSLRFVRKLQHELSIPLVLHFMDDFPGSYYRKGFFPLKLRQTYLKEFEELVVSADVAIAISEEMAEEYKNRYRRSVISLPMPVEIETYLLATRTEWKISTPFHIRYGGRVGWAIRDSLSDIANVVHSIRSMGNDIVFDIATFQKEMVPQACLSSSGVNLIAPQPLSEVPSLNAVADILIICFDFDQESIRQAKYSMPSKMADCMASGTPILVYGPAGLPVVEYARREGWGMVVDRRDSGALKTAICELQTSPMLREQLGRTSQRLAFERHDASIVSERLRSILNSVVTEDVCTKRKKNLSTLES